MPLPRYVLIGRIVTMDDQRTVVDEGALEVDGGTIAGVRPAGDRRLRAGRTRRASACTAPSSRA